jgi:hypothetical protein
LCSTIGCTGTISRESLAIRCLECVRRDWKSKISKGHTGHRADDERLSSETIERSISTKRKTKKAVTWADEVSYSPAFQQSLECTPTIKQLKPSSLKYGIHSADFPTPIDDVPTAGLNVQVGRQVGRPPSPPAEAQAPIKCLELNDPTTKSEDVSVFTEDLSALASSTPVSSDDLRLDTQVKCVVPIESSASLDMSSSVEVLNFSGSSDFSEHSRDDNESDKDIPSSESQEVDPHLPKRQTSSHSAPAGFKIRIPPRPGLYVQKCSSIRCEQRLPATYRWKLCMMCRARSREYQRKRQNLQGRHSQPEEGSQIIGGPLSSSYLMNDCTSEQSLLEPKAKSIPVHSVSGPLSYIHMIEDILIRLLVSGPVTLSSIQGLSKPVG